MGINQKLRDISANFDFFSVQPNLNVFRKQKYSTYLGTFVTLCVGAVTVAYLVLLLQELISKSLPIIIQSDRQVIETSGFPLKMDNFTLAVSVADMNQDPMKTINQYFTITIKNCVRTRRLNTTTSKIEVHNECITYPTEACSADDFVSDVQKSYFSKIRLGAVQCIKNDVWESNPPKLQGIVSGNDYAYLTIKFSKCKNTTESQNCASNEDIKAGLSKGYYAVHMSDTLLQMNSPGEISQDIIKLQYTTFSDTSSITIFQGFRIIESLTDDGFIMNNVKQDQKLIQQTYREQFTLYNDDFLVYHYIILDDKFTTYSRSYIKFQSILSKIGGLWQVLFLTVAVILKPFIETEMYIKICNEIFRFEQDEKNTENIECNKSKSNVMQMLSQLNPKFETNIMEIILLTLGCSRKKKGHLEQAKQQFFDMIDVISLANKSFQLEKIKFIILSDDQRQLFEFIPRPTIFIGQYTSDLLLSSGKLYENFSNKDDEKCQLACKSYFKLLQSPLEQNELDKRFLSYLDSNIIQLFQQLIYQKGWSKEQMSQYSPNRPSQSSEQKGKIVDSQMCFSPISQEIPAARILFIQKK